MRHIRLWLAQAMSLQSRILMLIPLICKPILCLGNLLFIMIVFIQDGEEVLMESLLQLLRRIKLLKVSGQRLGYTVLN